MDRLKVENSKLKIALSKAEEELDKMKFQVESRIANSKVNTAIVRPIERQDNPQIQQL